MCTVPGIIREVQDGGKVIFHDQELQHDELKGYEGSDVLLDLEVDVETEKSGFRIYTMFEDEICFIELGEIETIGEAANGS